jgi:hypothetical protein
MSDPESSGGEPDVAPKRVKPQDVISKRFNQIRNGAVQHERVFPVLSYFFVVVYVLCFVCLFKTNIEFISWFFFLLNLLFMLFIIKEFITSRCQTGSLRTACISSPTHIERHIEYGSPET